MAVNAAPSGKAPPGRLRFGAATMALATAFAVAACGSHADSTTAAARRRAVPRRMPHGYRTTQTPEERLT